MYVVGFDPGGEKAFGWAVLSVNGDNLSLYASGTCTGAPAALSAVCAATPIIPVAMGIDAPLFWVESGDRKADGVVRKMVCVAGGESGTVSHVNSLRGACLVQGILIARLATSIWPNSIVTEAHPKALRLVSQAARDFVADIGEVVRTDHERDAALAAYTAFAFLIKRTGWRDLVPLETLPFFPSGHRVSYWFPESRT